MRLRILAGAVAAAATLVLTSCAAGYDETTKDGLRQQVVAVAQASAAGDWTGALSSLDAMAERLSDARAAGEVSEERFDSILLAMELVRQDIDTAIAAAADAAERQRLMDEQARLQEQITRLEGQQNQPNEQPGEKKEGDKGGEGDNGEDGKGEERKGADEGKGAEQGKGK
ncbi:hypothetical protein [Agromyces ramosus]|uniref:Uncharacterized protein n=1 Tax=Agromyces ramosus TaxID=33879 RepID=A0ABU0RAR7_9MICO|nr:hypothetical protein [Agromyces ramosus]MDQ0895175.1 hypothetical protein [Agromyces ramosus]